MSRASQTQSRPRGADGVPTLAPLSPRPDVPVAAQVFQSLRDAIVSGRLPPGQQLSEQRLCDQLGTSRQPVREALLRLVWLDLVITFPQRGSYVAPISVPQIRRAQLIRELIEVDAIRRVARTPDAGLILQLDAALLQQTACAQAHDTAAFYEADNRFHALVLEASGVHGLWDELSGLKVHLDRMRSMTLDDATKPQDLLRDHQAIRDAIAGAAPQDACRAVEVHLRRVLADLKVYRARFPERFQDD